MRKTYIQLIGFILGFLLLTEVSAAPSPLPMMQQIAQDMISALKTNQSRLAGNTTLVRQIVNQVLIPHVDIDAMSGRVVGRNYWLSASNAERKTFSELFKNTVLSTYASALTSYDRDRVLFYPLRGTIGDSAQVRSIIVRRSGQEIAVSYNLRYQNGSWKIVDLSVENVSIVNNYQAQYAGTLSQGGLKYLIEKLKH
jgi:phospholipid transport system substrate-binding protein